MSWRLGRPTRCVQSRACCGTCLGDVSLTAGIVLPQAAIVALSKRFGVSCKFTAFVAVDQRTRAVAGSLQRVRGGNTGVYPRSRVLGSSTGTGQLFFKTLTGKTITGDVDLGTGTVADLKQIIYESEGIPPDQVGTGPSASLHEATDR
jgi:hypothetical protein